MEFTLAHAEVIPLKTTKPNFSVLGDLKDYLSIYWNHSYFKSHYNHFWLWISYKGFNETYFSKYLHRSPKHAMTFYIISKSASFFNALWT